MKLIVNDWIYTIEIESYAAAVPAYLSGPPEDCTPAEPAEVEYLVIDIELDRDAVAFGGDIESLVNNWSKLDKLIINQIELSV